MSGQQPFERRRAEDVFRVVENEVFPRLGAIDTKIDSLERGVRTLTIEGCAHRAADNHRVEVVETGIARIFEKMDTFSVTLTEHRVAVTAQIGAINTNMAKNDGGVRTWVLVGALILLMGIAGYFIRDYLHDIEQSVGKAQATVPAKRVTPKTE